MKKITLLAMVALALSGCATPNEMRQGKASLVLESALPSKNVAKCIFDKWENDGPNSLVGLISKRDLMNGYMVAYAIDGIVYVMADVIDLSGNRSRTSVYTNFGLSDSFSKLTKDCQQ